jgi:hypothetical protein
MGAVIPADFDGLTNRGESVRIHKVHPNRRVTQGSLGRGPDAAALEMVRASPAGSRTGGRVPFIVDRPAGRDLKGRHPRNFRDWECR